MGFEALFRYSDTIQESLQDIKKENKMKTQWYLSLTSRTQ